MGFQNYNSLKIEHMAPLVKAFKNDIKLKNNETIF